MSDRDRPGLLSRTFGPAGGRRAAWRRRVTRRCGAALLVAAAATTAVGVLRPSSPDVPTRVVVVAARPLPAGAVLAAGDLTTRSYPADLAPSGTASDPAAFVGRAVAGPVGRDEVLTTGRLVDTALLANLPAGTVALPIAASAESTALLRTGLRVDGFLPGRSAPVVRGALVLAVSADRADPLGATPTSTRVVLAVTEGQASAVFAGFDPAGTGTALTLAAY